MSRRLTQQVKRLAQRGATKDTIASHVVVVFPKRGARTKDKLARLVNRYLQGRKKAA